MRYREAREQLPSGAIVVDLEPPHDLHRVARVGFVDIGVPVLECQGVFKYGYFPCVTLQMNTYQKAVHEVRVVTPLEQIALAGDGWAVDAEDIITRGPAREKLLVERIIRLEEQGEKDQ